MRKVQEANLYFKDINKQFTNKQGGSVNDREKHNLESLRKLQIERSRMNIFEDNNRVLSLDCIKPMK
jgi:hypothetical protein